ncbi:hypothetical protein [Roseateles sp.]|uniref:hypothetical protein n=1 Tax=Roseateles sp. TaxID=1971397 RepID=UPI0032664E6B
MVVVSIAAVVGVVILGVAAYWPDEAPPTIHAAPRAHIVSSSSATSGPNKPNSSQPLLEQRAATQVIENETLRSFDSTEDLYEYANAAVNSSNARVVYDGWLAARGCAMLRSSRDEYERKITTSEIDSNGEQARAIRMVIKRCRGFFDNDRAANSGLSARLAQKVRATNNGLYVAGISTGAPSAEQFGDVVARRDWVTFSAIQGLLLPKTLQAAGIANGSEEAILFSIAWMKSACDIGMDCTPTGFSYASRCADTGQCPGSWEKEAEIGMTAAYKEKIGHYQAQIAEAVASRNYKFFGFGPP